MILDAPHASPSLRIGVCNQTTYAKPPSRSQALFKLAYLKSWLIYTNTIVPSPPTPMKNIRHLPRVQSRTNNPADIYLHKGTSGTYVGHLVQCRGSGAASSRYLVCRRALAGYALLAGYM